MTYILLAISCIIGILTVQGLFKKKLNIAAWFVCALFFIFFIFSAIQEKDNVQEKEYSKNTGILKTEPTDSTRLIWLIGKSGFIFPEGKIVLSEFNTIGYIFKTKKWAKYRPFEGVDFTAWIENRKLYVSTIIRDTIGNVIAEMSKNEWIVNKPTFSLDRNFDSNALEVKDNLGQIIFQIEIEGNKMRMNGKFNRLDGQLAIANTMEDLTDSTNIVGAISVIEKGDYKDVANYEKFDFSPIFKYPSDLHKGERVK